MSEEGPPHSKRAPLQDRICDLGRNMIVDSETLRMLEIGHGKNVRRRTLYHGCLQAGVVAVLHHIKGGVG
jgi:hypothetical protein